MHDYQEREVKARTTLRESNSISERSKELYASIEQAHEALGHLASKLEPVLRRTDDDPENTSPGYPRYPNESPLASNLADYISGTRRLTERINELHQRIEL